MLAALLTTVVAALTLGMAGPGAAQQQEHGAQTLQVSQPQQITAASTQDTAPSAQDTAADTSDDSEDPSSPADTAEAAEPATTETGAQPTTTEGAGTGGDPVPCEVAMVVGCVATVDRGDGPVSVTLAVNGLAANGTAANGAVVTNGTGQGLQETEQAQGEERPRSDVDPWERGGLKSNFGSRSIPISHYQIGADTTGWLGVPDPLDSFVASQTNWAFTTSTFLVLLATNALDWAFEFPLAEDLIGDAGVLAQNYTVDLFGFGLATSIYSLALSVTMVVAGFKAVTKGVIAAGSEVGIAFVAYVLLIVLTLTAGFGDAGLSVARVSSDLSASIASFAAGQERQAECAAELQAGDGDQQVSVAGAEAATGGATTAAAGSSACSFGFALQRSLVELPYQNLQWGQVLDGVSGKEQCAALNMELLAEGPWGNDDQPRERMAAIPECEENANFNHHATYIRLGIASANTIATALVTLLVLVVAAMLLWQQVKLLFLTVTIPHALVFAILPGRSRRLAWTWVEHLMGVVIRTVILSLGLVVWLSLFSLIVHEQLTLRGIFLSLFASVAMAVSGFYGLYRLSGMTKRVNPAKQRDRDESGEAGDEDGTSSSRTRRVVAVGARSAMRSVGARRTAGRGFGGSSSRDPLIGGGPGDLPGGGAAASPGSGPVGAGRT